MTLSVCECVFLQKHTYVQTKWAYTLFYCKALCWPAVCVIGPCSHLKYAQLSFSLPVFFLMHSVILFVINRTCCSDKVHVDFCSKSGSNERQWYNENEFGLSVSAAESSWRERVSETSAPAGYCACSSVPHGPHWWVSCLRHGLGSFSE